MQSGRDLRWRAELAYSSDFVRAGTTSRLYRMVDDGALRRVAAGIFLPSERWDNWSDEERFRAQIVAAAERFPEDGPSTHLSAAAMWGLPIVGPLPAKPEVLMPRTTGGRSREGIARRAGRNPELIESIDGVPVVGLARVVVDVARTSPLSTAIAIADHVMRPPRADEVGIAAARVTRAELLEQVERIDSRVGATIAAFVVEFADGKSGSPGESISQMGMHLVGLPAPELQVPFVDSSGLIGITDFWWRSHRRVGEFDGVSKYIRAELTDGRTVAEVVLDEKVRESRLRDVTDGVSRWGWDVALRPRRLARLLADAGLPLRRRNHATLREFRWRD